MRQTLYTLIVMLFTYASVLAQAPQAMNYQAVARDAAGNVMANKTITVRLTIHNNTMTGAIAYVETDTVVTNEFGVFTIAMGRGTTIPGGFSGIAWGSGNKYLQVETDPQGGSNFSDMGTSQLLSVPYALMSENVITTNYPASASDSSSTFLAQTLRNLWAEDPDVSVTVPETGKYLLSFYGNMFNTNTTFDYETSYDSDGEMRVYNETSSNEIFRTTTLSVYNDLYTANNSLRKYYYLRPSRTLIANLSANDVLKLQYRQFAFGNPLPTGAWYIGAGGITIVKIGN